MFLIIKGPTIYYYSCYLHLLPTRKIDNQQKHRNAVKVNRDIPGIRQRNRVNLRFLDKLESLYNHPHLSSNSSGVKDIEEVITKEKKPVGHGKTQKFHKVEQITRYLNKRPANGKTNEDLNQNNALPHQHKLDSKRLLGVLADIGISPEHHHTRKDYLLFWSVFNKIYPGDPLSSRGNEQGEAWNEQSPEWRPSGQHSM